MPDVRHPRVRNSASNAATMILAVLLLNECAEEGEAITRHLASVGIDSVSPKPLAIIVVQVHLVLNDIVAALELVFWELISALKGAPQKRVVARALFWMAVTKHEDGRVDSVYRVRRLSLGITRAAPGSLETPFAQSAELAVIWGLS